MAGILGIDAAWTEKEPSGVALIEGARGGWRCVAVTPSYGSFLALAEGRPVDWNAKTEGALPDVGRLVAAAETLLGGRQLTVVTVDMPLSTKPITGRRTADTAIARLILPSLGLMEAGAPRSTRPAPNDPGPSATSSPGISPHRGFPWRPAPRPRVPPTVWLRSIPIQPL